jgi:hypothetical protein
LVGVPRRPSGKERRGRSLLIGVVTVFATSFGGLKLPNDAGDSLRGGVKYCSGSANGDLRSFLKGVSMLMRADGGRTCVPALRLNPGVGGGRIFIGLIESLDVSIVSAFFVFSFQSPEKLLRPSLNDCEASVCRRKASNCSFASTGVGDGAAMDRMLELGLCQFAFECWPPTTSRSWEESTTKPK